MFCFTIAASPSPYGKVFRDRGLLPAAGTDLTARKESVDSNQSLSLFFQLVLQEIGKHAPSVIHDLFPEVHFLRHRLYIQVLNAYAVIRVGYPDAR